MVGRTVFTACAKDQSCAYTVTQTRAYEGTWERLEDCFGSPEIIEKSLFDRIDSFPKIGNRDVKDASRTW